MDEKVATLRGTGAFGRDDDEGSKPPQPGLIAVFSSGSPIWSLWPIPLPIGELELGRDNLGTQIGDGRISRRHIRVSVQGGSFVATDLGSLNGSGIDGHAAVANQPRVCERCLRIGDTLLVPCVDLRGLAMGPPSARDGLIVGPRLAKLYERIARHSGSSMTLNITGESGAGKENAARAFHAQSNASRGPFVAVNCATIPEGIAERLLFGAKRGAFSGAVADADGYVQSAHNGTLFLDEVAELHATVQAKLLRVLEAREVLAVGAVKPQPVNLRVVSASHRSLYAEVAAGRLREDLYYRLGRPSEHVPALRERPEEIPWLIQHEIQKLGSGLVPHSSFVEACILRHWPGNVRELLVEIRTAVQEAIASDQKRVRVEHLAANAGLLIRPQSNERELLTPPVVTPSAPTPKEGVAKDEVDRPSKAQLIAALLDAQLNISAAARQLGVHRTQLRRFLEYYGIDLEHLRAIEKK